MPEVTTEKVFLHGTERNEFKMSYDINVTTDGTFTTTLPAEFVQLFKAANIDLSRNNRRGSKEGFVSDETLDGLKKKVLAICTEYMSREMISERLVIRYNVETICSYLINDAGDIVPNGRFVEDYGGRHHWKNGTTEVHAASPGKGTGMRVYAKPAIERVYKYKSGKEKTEYETLNSYPGQKNDHFTIGENFIWLDNVCSIDPWGQLKIIEYNEAIAGFFVKFIKMICQFNEQIKDYLTPEAIRLLAESSMPFLLGNDTKPSK